MKVTVKTLEENVYPADKMVNGNMAIVVRGPGVTPGEPCIMSHDVKRHLIFPRVGLWGSEPSLYFVRNLKPGESVVFEG